LRPVNNPETVEAVLSSGRMRILRLLAERGALTLSDIALRTGTSRQGARRQLRILEEAGLVRKHRQGRESAYSFNLENPRALEVERLFALWRGESRHHSASVE